MLLSRVEQLGADVEAFRMEIILRREASRQHSWRLVSRSFKLNLCMGTSAVDCMAPQLGWSESREQYIIPAINTPSDPSADHPSQEQTASARRGPNRALTTGKLRSLAPKRLSYWAGTNPMELLNVMAIEKMRGLRRSRFFDFSKLRI